MEVKEELVKFELLEVTPKEDFVVYYEDYAFEFPIANGKLLNYFQS